MSSSRSLNAAIRRALANRRPGPPVWDSDPASLGLASGPLLTGAQRDQLSRESHAEFDLLGEHGDAVRVAIDALVGLLAPDRRGVLIAALANLSLEPARRAEIARAASRVIIRVAPAARRPALAWAPATPVNQLAWGRP